MYLQICISGRNLSDEHVYHIASGLGIEEPKYKNKNYVIFEVLKENLKEFRGINKFCEECNLDINDLNNFQFKTIGLSESVILNCFDQMDGMWWKNLLNLYFEKLRGNNKLWYVNFKDILKADEFEKYDIFELNKNNYIQNCDESSAAIEFNLGMSAFSAVNDKITINKNKKQLIFNNTDAFDVLDLILLA